MAGPCCADVLAEGEPVPTGVDDPAAGEPPDGPVQAVRTSKAATDQPIRT